MLIHKNPGKEAPCKRACLLGVDVPRYIRLINLKKYEEALSVIRERNPFPSVCGRVCTSLCEEACDAHHHHESGAVEINALKRFVTERVSTPFQYTPPAKSSDKRVAVVGSGPAGLTAAFYLSKLGHGVTVLEASPVIGGMMRTIIPEYRLPKKALDKNIAEIKSIGFEIRTNTTVDSPDDLLGHGYDAVFLALGTQRGIPLMPEGEDFPGIVHAMSFLRDVKAGKKPNLGDRVVVVGGGYAAIDSARTALRLGTKEVTLLSPRARAEMPNSSQEIKETLNEGVEVIFLAAPEKISRENGRINLKYTPMEPCKPDADDLQQSTPTECKKFSMDIDSIVAAVGEIPDIPTQFDLKTGKGNTVQIDRRTLATSRQGIFAGGAMTNGSRSIIKAIASGRRAAFSIDRYLGGHGETEKTTASHKEERPQFLGGVPVGERAKMQTLDLNERLSGFGEVELGLDEDAAVQEASRCLWCDLPIWADTVKCAGCLRCALSCGFRFNEAFNPIYGKIKIVPPDRSTQPGESEISFADDCDNCGICVRTCPYDVLTRDKPQRDKGESNWQARGGA